MDTQPAPFSFDHNPLRTWGIWAIAAGALAMVLAFYQIIGPSLEPQPSAGSQIGQTAGEMARSAWRAFRGLPPEVAAVEPVKSIDYLAFGAPVLGVIALVLSCFSGLRRENWRYPLYSATLGAGAIVAYFLWWIALLICGAILLIAIIENIGSFFDIGIGSPFD